MISIVIPTHNRASDLARCLSQLQLQSNKSSFEVVVVLNNCSDNSLSIAQACSNLSISIVDEPNTAFSKARDSGARAAQGSILLFLDDDAELWPDSLEIALAAFRQEPQMGMLAGRIEPRFEADPPDWALRCQESHNAWSLFSPLPTERAEHIHHVEWAAGPCMAIRTDVYWESGGFPPDTLGVESNEGDKTFKKWYVGPGDYGLSQRIRATGRFIGYTSQFGVNHVVSATRMTPAFWLSRFYGEGVYLAISDRQFWRRGRVELKLRVLRARLRRRRALSRWWLDRRLHDQPRLTPASLDAAKWLAYAATAQLCDHYPNLAPSLWDMATHGVPDSDFDRCRRSLPEEFIRLAEPNFDEASKAPDPLRYLKRFVSTSLHN